MEKQQLFLVSVFKHSYRIKIQPYKFPNIYLELGLLVGCSIKDPSVPPPTGLLEDSGCGGYEGLTNPLESITVSKRNIYRYEKHQPCSASSILVRRSFAAI